MVCRETWLTERMVEFDCDPSDCEDGGAIDRALAILGRMRVARIVTGYHTLTVNLVKEYLSQHETSYIMTISPYSVATVTVTYKIDAKSGERVCHGMVSSKGGYYSIPESVLDEARWAARLLHSLWRSGRWTTYGYTDTIVDIAPPSGIVCRAVYDDDSALRGVGCTKGEEMDITVSLGSGEATVVIDKDRGSDTRALRGYIGALLRAARETERYIALIRAASIHGRDYTMACNGARIVLQLSSRERPLPANRVIRIILGTHADPNTLAEVFSDCVKTLAANIAADNLPMLASLLLQ